MLNPRELEELTQMLHGVQRRVFALIKALPVGTILVRPDGTVDSSAQVFCSVFGYEAERLNDLRLDELLVTSGSLEELLEQIRLCISENFACVAKVRQGDGAIRDAEIFAGVMELADDESFRYVLSFVDTAATKSALK